MNEKNAFYSTLKCLETDFLVRVLSRSKENFSFRKLTPIHNEVMIHNKQILSVVSSQFRLRIDSEGNRKH